MAPTAADAKCLIVDDDPVWLNLLQVIVNHPKLEYMNDAVAALAALRANGFVMLITDTNMPGMNGLDLLREVRADAKLKDLPVIVLFNGLAGSKMSREDVFAAGASMVLTKEEFLAQHASLLRRWLGP